MESKASGWFCCLHLQFCAVQCYLFSPPFPVLFPQNCYRYNSLHLFWLQLPKQVAVHGHGRGSMWEGAGGMSVVNIVLRIDVTGRRFSTFLLIY